jgi:hypothetical protein
MKRGVLLAVLIAAFSLASWLTSPSKAEAYGSCAAYQGQRCGPPLPPPISCSWESLSDGYCVCKDQDPGPALVLVWECGYMPVS